MQRKFLLLCAFVVLSGCVTSEQKCAQLGYRPGTTDFLNCYNAAEARQQAGWAAMQQWGQAQQAQQNVLMQSALGGQTQTTCRPVGNSVQCNSW